MAEYMLQEPKNNIWQNTAPLLVQFLINYIKYFFLTGSVVFSTFVLLVVIVSINPDFSFGFLQLFSFLNPAYKTGTFRMGIKEIMEIFAVVSLALLVIVWLAKAALKKFFNFSLKLRLKHKIIIFFALITSAYILAALIAKFAFPKDLGYYLVFAVFYVFNLVSAVFYFLLDTLQETIARALEKKATYGNNTPTPTDTFK
jgi:hypothetical protein